MYFIIIKVIIKLILFCYRELPWIVLKEARIQDNLAYMKTYGFWKQNMFKQSIITIEI